MPYVITYDEKNQEYLGLPKTEKFPWTRRKLETLELAKLYRRTDHHRDEAGLVGSCCTWLGYDVLASGEHKLSGANFCQRRLCPLCTERRARKAAWRLSEVLATAGRELGLRYIFATLTVRNVPGVELGPEIGRLNKGWYNLYRITSVRRAIEGWYRAIECTYDAGTDTYHPHIHAILAVRPEYFERSSGLWVSQSALGNYWRRAMGLDYDPIIHIEAAHDADKQSIDCAGMSAALEAAKYATKSIEYLGKGLPLPRRTELVEVYTDALYSRRLTAYGGALRKIAHRLGADKAEVDTDLVHVDEDSCRDSEAIIARDYRWRTTRKDYELSGERPPLSRR